MKSRNESLIRLRKFTVDEKRRAVTQIEMMVADFERMAAELDQQIEIEHQKKPASRMWATLLIRLLQKQRRIAATT